MDLHHIPPEAFQKPLRSPLHFSYRPNIYVFKFIYLINHILNMASKTIKITEDVYQLLKNLKKRNESFSELLRRLAIQINGRKLDIFFGAWDIEDEEYDNIE
ncbi:MAG: hypothetical protein EU549_01185, partial [Promethearchaeota archaeon]